MEYVQQQACKLKAGYSNCLRTELRTPCSTHRVSSFGRDKVTGHWVVCCKLLMPVNLHSSHMLQINCIRCGSISNVMEIKGSLKPPFGYVKGWYDTQTLSCCPAIYEVAGNSYFCCLQVPWVVSLVVHQTLSWQLCTSLLSFQSWNG